MLCQEKWQRLSGTAWSLIGHSSYFLKLVSPLGLIFSTSNCFKNSKVIKSYTLLLCESSSCSIKPVISGVPQGTVLGPLLFLAYINDLPLAASSSVRLFADDCLLYRRIKTTQDTNIFQSDLNNLQKWEARCQMMFNTDKCEVLCITLNKKNVICADYTIHCQPLSLISSAKYLGVTTDSKLTFNEHINDVTHKANSTRAFVARNTQKCHKINSL